VNIPQAETRILKDVLELPWGFELYSLLTRWNPFNFNRWVPRAPTGRTILVVGMGPAGYTLAHHLLNDGHAVVGIDALKLEPLQAGLAALDCRGKPVPFALLRDVSKLTVPLDERVSGGFGGVAEYGITVRWDKNFLTILRILLERRIEFTLRGGVRFGGALSSDSAFEMGFDHIALCTGAGKPTTLGLKNGLAPGVRQASDFLMALQLTGAARSGSLTNLQVRLPILVIGGGLTAIDTCTEALAYYPVQIEKFLSRYEDLCDRLGEQAVRSSWNEAEREIAEEFLAHARQLRAEHASARALGHEADVLRLLQSWGGARIVYRRAMTSSPAYSNHEEVEKALQEGIVFGEDLLPVAVEIDRFGNASGLRASQASTGEEISLAARSIFVAAGTSPNIIIAGEESGYEVDGKYFQAFSEEGERVTPQRCAKPEAAAFVVQRRSDGRAVTFFGDLHPSYAGNVVTAMASAKTGYPLISRLVGASRPRSTPSHLHSLLRAALTATVERVERLTGNIVEVVVHAPLAARAFRPGQFFRLQNFEMTAAAVDATRLAMEGIALTGAWVNTHRGQVGLIALEMGGSSSLCELLRPGEAVVLMGPTGEPTEIVRGQTVLLAGGGLGNAVLFSIGRALRAAGSRVLYFAGYRRYVDVFKRSEIEGAAEVVVWCCDTEPAPVATRDQDFSFSGNIVDAMTAYARGSLGPTSIALRDVDRIIAIGSDRMMAAVALARQRELAPYLKPDHVAIASINSPMQCMMKEICGQCLQVQRDPSTGAETIVFSCRFQDQPAEKVDFGVLRGRLTQNSLQEKLTADWIASCRARLKSTRGDLA
jgi:NADPH-dependent glutamate synthase beta subunit-like oxidoreductase/NAD(P)H-flavin reductase